MVVTNRGVSGQQRTRAGTRSPAPSFPAPNRPNTRERLVAENDAATQWRENYQRGPLASLWRRVKRKVWQRFNRLNAPVVYAWSPSHKGDAVAHELHRVAADLLRNAAKSPLARAWLRVKSAAWPPLATLGALAVLARSGPVVRARHGLSLREQWRDMLEAAWRHGIFPTEYFHHRVFASQARLDKSLYLNEREIVALLAAADRDAPRGRVDEVRRFHAECRTAELPVPRTFAAFRSGQVELFCGNSHADLPRKDIFVRPERWADGCGAQIWRWNPQTCAWHHCDESCDAASLVARLRELSKQRPYLAQDCLRNHPDVARFSAGGLCSVRVATGIDENGKPQPFFATLQMPASDVNGGDTPVGTLLAGVDLGDGTLQSAWGELVSDGEFDTHPGSGAVITGVMLPQWQGVLDLALRAHQRFHEIPFVGWEIAISAAGPVLVEASTNWGSHPHVLPMETPFAALCLKRLQRQG